MPPTSRMKEYERLVEEVGVLQKKMGRQHERRGQSAGQWHGGRQRGSFGSSLARWKGKEAKKDDGVGGRKPSVVGSAFLRMGMVGSKWIGERKLGQNHGQGLQPHRYGSYEDDDDGADDEEPPPWTSSLLSTLRLAFASHLHAFRHEEEQLPLLRALTSPDLRGSTKHWNEALTVLRVCAAVQAIPDCRPQDGGFGAELAACHSGSGSGSDATTLAAWAGRVPVPESALGSMVDLQRALKQARKLALDAEHAVTTRFASAPAALEALTLMRTPPPPRSGLLGDNEGEGDDDDDPRPPAVVRLVFDCVRLLRQQPMQQVSRYAREQSQLVVLGSESGFENAEQEAREKRRANKAASLVQAQWRGRVARLRKKGGKKGKKGKKGKAGKSKGKGKGKGKKKKKGGSRPSSPTATAGAAAKAAAAESPGKEKQNAPDGQGKKLQQVKAAGEKPGAATSSAAATQGQPPPPTDRMSVSSDMGSVVQQAVRAKLAKEQKATKARAGKCVEFLIDSFTLEHGERSQREERKVDVYLEKLAAFVTEQGSDGLGEGGGGDGGSNSSNNKNGGDDDDTTRDRRFTTSLSTVATYSHSSRDCINPETMEFLEPYLALASQGFTPANVDACEKERARREQANGKGRTGKGKGRKAAGGKGGKPEGESAGA
eukprot:g2882.t1